MRSLWTSRRLFAAVFGMFCLVIIAVHNKVDSSMAIASIAMALCASNSYEKSKKPQ